LPSILFYSFSNIPNIEYEKIVLICVLGMVGAVACDGRGSGVRGGGERGDGPGHPRQRGIERV